MELENYIRFENKESVIAGLNGLEKDVQTQVVENLKTSGDEVRNKLRDSLPQAPTDTSHSAPGGVPFSQTGALKRKIQAKVLPLMLGEPISLLIYVSKKGFYGRMLEFGTSKMAARPWFFSGIKQMFPYLTESVDKALQEIVERRNRRTSK